MSAQQQTSDAFTTEHLRADLKGRSVRGGVLTFASQGTQFVILSISTVVLARLLSPADFGLVAMVTSITALGQAFADLGLSEATIQHPEISHSQVSTLFWVNAVVGLMLMSITMALAPVLAWFYREPRLKAITLFVSLIFLISGLRVQHDALLKRQMRFASLAMRDVLSCALAVPAAIGLARLGYGYWSIVALPLTLNLAQMLLSWAMVPWVPSIPRRDAKIRSLIAFGGNVAASYFVLNVSRSADNVLIGWRWGAGPLGLYSRAYNLLMLPVRQLSAPAVNVTVPVFSRVQDNAERFARYYLRAVNLLTWFAAPIFGFLFVAAEPVVVLILGNRWRESAPVFRILAISSLGQLLLEPTIWLLVSRGQSQRLLKVFLVISPIVICSFIIGLPFGIKGVALSGSLVLLVMFPWVLRYSFYGTELTLRRLGRAMVHPIVVCSSGICSAELALRLMLAQGTFSQLLIAALGFAGGCSLSFLVPSVRQEGMSLIRLLRKSSSAESPDLAETAR
jgi:PST family polysaccharide transporter